MIAGRFLKKENDSPTSGGTTTPITRETIAKNITNTKMIANTRGILRLDKKVNSRSQPAHENK